MTDTRSARDRYAARVDAVIEQRTRLRGPEPPGDLFDRLPADHPLLRSDSRRTLEPNLEVIASYIEPEDTLIDVGGGAGRYSLPLALRCRELINVEPSGGMAAGFAANAERAGIANARHIKAGWPMRDPPIGTAALVNHVTYLTRDILPFLEALEQSAPRRVLMTVNAPPPPSRHARLFALLHGEAEQVVPGHAELIDVLWEQGILPDVRVLPASGAPPVAPAPSREQAEGAAMASFSTEQWGFWPLGDGLQSRLRTLLETRFDELFLQADAGFVPRWITPGREVLITWRPQQDRISG